MTGATEGEKMREAHRKSVKQKTPKPELKSFEFQD